MPKSMSERKFNAFVDSRPGWIVLTIIGKDDFPHSVPLGFFRDGETVYLGCRDDTQKVCCIERNAKVSLMVETGSSMADIKGATIQGKARIVRDAAGVLEAMRKGAKKRGVPESELPTEARPGSAFIEVSVVNRISWD